MTIPETLRQASEALQQASAALVATAKAMEDAPGAEPAPEPEPGEWRNDRAPGACFSDTDVNGKVWAWDNEHRLTAKIYWRSVCNLMRVHKLQCFWAPGNQPKPTSPPLVSMTDGHGAKLGPAPPPDVVGSQDVEPEKPKPFSVLTPEQTASMERTKANGGWIIDKLPTEMDADGEDDVRVPNALGIPRHYVCVPYYAVQLGAPWCSPDDTPAPWDPTCLDRNGWIRSRLPTVEDASYSAHVLIPVGNGGTTSTIAYHLIVPGQPWAPWGSNPGGFEK